MVKKFLLLLFLSIGFSGTSLGAESKVQQAMCAAGNVMWFLVRPFAQVDEASIMEFLPGAVKPTSMQQMGGRMRAQWKEACVMWEEAGLPPKYVVEAAKPVAAVLNHNQKPKPNEVLIWWYGTDLWIFKFCHYKPYTYFATLLKWSALIALTTIGIKKTVNYLKQQKNTQQEKRNEEYLLQIEKIQ